jgi:hypothetical protein
MPEERDKKDEGIDRKEVLKSIFDKLEDAEVAQKEKVERERKKLVDFFEEEKRKREVVEEVKVEKRTIFTYLIENRKIAAGVVCVLIGLAWLVAGALSLKIIPCLIFMAIFLIPGLICIMAVYMQKIALEQQKALETSSEEETEGLL